MDECLLERNCIFGWNRSGKIGEQEEAIAKIAELLETTPEVIEKKLSAQWVKDDSFVPIKTIPRVEEIELLKVEPDEDVLKEKERHESLLAIPGVMISDVEVREYPLVKRLHIW